MLRQRDFKNSIDLLCLGIAESTRRGPELTERGRELQQASVGNRKSILRDELLKLPVVQAYCDRAPDEEFRNRDIMGQISENYIKEWSDSTIQTRAKRLYSWLLFTDLFEESSRGYLVPKTSAEPSESVAT